jgi:ParB family chromosome partitioning protein
LALGENRDTALVALVHALAAKTFYGGYGTSCLDIEPNSQPLSGHADGIEDSVAARKLADRHATWARQMPRDAAQLWGFVRNLDHDSRMALFAHCTALSVFAVQLPWDRRDGARANADALAQMLGLDMTAYWTATAQTYFGRVPKARILEAVREACCGETAARLLGMKKQPMAEAAEQLVTGTGWLPEPLRIPAAPEPATPDADAGEAGGYTAAAE